MRRRRIWNSTTSVMGGINEGAKYMQESESEVHRSYCIRVIFDDAVNLFSLLAKWSLGHV